MQKLVQKIKQNQKEQHRSKAIRQTVLIILVVFEAI